MNITVKQLRFFVAVADLGNFTRAASHLNVAQPALSACIRDLEAELRVRLFDRTTRRVDLTGAGQEFLASARRLLLDLDVAVKNSHDLADRKRGRIVIAGPPMLASVLLPEAIAEHRKAFPVINVHFLDAPSSLVPHRVRSGEADWGLGTFGADEPDVVQSVLFNDPLMVFCNRKSPLVRKREVRWADLEGLPHIVLSRDINIRSLVEQHYAQAAAYIRPAHEVMQITTALMLAEAGEGVAILPKIPALPWTKARSNQVVGRPLVEPKIQRAVSIIHATERALSPAAESFEAFLRKAMRSSLEN
jgi:DNA-binding transcriptional LysR family regulator